MNLRQIRALLGLAGFAFAAFPAAACAESRDYPIRPVDFTRVVIRGRAFASGTETAFLAVPYSVWAHRGAGEMAVWLPRTGAALPHPVAPGRKSAI
jgi:DUF1680 family protein